MAGNNRFTLPFCLTNATLFLSKAFFISPPPMNTNQAMLFRPIFWVLFACSVSMGAYVFIYFFPGSVSPDSLSILTQARTGVFSDHHPPFLAMIWRPLDQFIPGPSPILFLNLFLFYGGLFLIFTSLVPRYGYSTIVGLVVIGLYPPIIGILGVIWIDIAMAAFYVMAIGLLLLSTTLLETKRILRYMSIAFAVVFIYVGSAFRHNGFAAAFALMCFAYLVLYSFKPLSFKLFLRTFLAGITGVFLSLMLTQIISGILVTQKSQIWRIGAIYDIAGSSFYSNQNLFNQEIFPNTNLHDIKALYSPRSWIPLSMGTQIHGLTPEEIKISAPAIDIKDNEKNNKLLLANWIGAISTHPLEYFQHRYNIFKILVGPSPWGLWAPVYDVIYENSLGINNRATPDLWLYKYIYSISQSPLFYPIHYLFISIFGLFITLFLGIKLQNSIYLLVSMLYLSGIANMAVLFFLVASTDFRYSHWLIVSCSIGSILSLLESCRLLLKNRK